MILDARFRGHDGGAPPTSLANFWDTALVWKLTGDLLFSAENF